MADPPAPTTTAAIGDYVLTLTCPDRPEIVHAVSGFLVEHGGNIIESQQFDDQLSGNFFMRIDFETVDQHPDVAELRHAFAPLAEKFGMTFQLWEARQPFRTLIMVSRQLHCLNDLLFRHSTGALNTDIRAVVSNHPDAEELARDYHVPFHHIPVTPDTKPQAETALLDLVRSEHVDLLVLARYMQVLSNDVCAALSGRVINIHHSFLPSFKGGHPYRQAFDRGVKLVGATAHYVTADLDEGPIISQDVTDADHTLTPRRLAAAGRDIEARVLSRAVRWHCESRVLLNGNRTVIFR